MSSPAPLPTLYITPSGHPALEQAADTSPLRAAFSLSPAHGLLHLAGPALTAPLEPGLSFARQLAKDYLTRLCRLPADSAAVSVPAPAIEDFALRAMTAPPMRGVEYLTADALAAWWAELDALVRDRVAYAGSLAPILADLNPAWHTVGRLILHLAENKRDPEYPFAFIATYAATLSAAGRSQHVPLSRALDEFKAAKDRPALLKLLKPLSDATTLDPFIKSLVDTGQVYRTLAWTPRQAYQFLQAVPALESSGVVVRVPDWWRASKPARPTVDVKIGSAAKTTVGLSSLLDFRVDVALDGTPLTPDELRALLDDDQPFVSLRGRWVELDKAKLRQALDHWKAVERDVGDGVTFAEAMRLLSGVNLPADDKAPPLDVRPWTGITPGPWLEQTLSQLRSPDPTQDPTPKSLQATLRPYQKAGLAWLRFMTSMRLGACLADDMGLGKTIQLISLLLHLYPAVAGKHQTPSTNPQTSSKKRTPNLKASPHPPTSPIASPPSDIPPPTSDIPSLPPPSPQSAIRNPQSAINTPTSDIPSLLVVPASLIPNWRSEIARFAPSLSVLVVHPSAVPPADLTPELLSGTHLVITTYGMLARSKLLSGTPWKLAVLDEAQAIKNAGSAQSRTVKALTADARIALTGTPIENRLSDLWSLFDFLNPGLLGSAKVFSDFVKRATKDEPPQGLGALRTLVRPYILRRLKTDKSVISDLPDKVEMKTFCTLSPSQAAVYQAAVDQLTRELNEKAGIERRGIVLAYLMRFKQICNHPAQATGDADYSPARSGKFERLADICAELAARQQRCLVFTQFREITAPLAEHLASVFGRPGLVLHGDTSVPQRKKLVDAFQSTADDAPPFFVLSLKAGGTGLNLTAASHVIHFDRWWNPAVENQATDRAFRIGQKSNVLVHKFVTQGTVEERIDALIEEKKSLADDLFSDDTTLKALTEMNDKDLLNFVSLDLTRATT